MATLAEQALASLDSDRPELGIELAVSFFELAAGRRTGLDRFEVRGEPATANELVRLRERLVERVRSGAPMAGGAVFALGKLHAAGLAPFFVEVVRSQLDGDENVLYQAMIALDNLGEPVFAGQDSMSVTDVAENRSLAVGYLKAIGAV